MERLRHVARAGPLEHAVLVNESAAALAALGDDGAGLLLSCRRLLERHPASGPLWWMCARVLCADVAGVEAWRCVEELDGDETPRQLGAAMPDGATVAVLGWPEVAAEGLASRGDVRVLVVDALGEGAYLARRFRAMDFDVEEVDDAGAGAAVVASDLLVVEASALGPGGFVAIPGSRAAAAVARHAGVPVWLVAGVGRALPPGLWSALAGRVAGNQPWRAAQEVVPLDLADALVRPGGRCPAVDAARRPPDAPDVPELL